MPQTEAERFKQYAAIEPRDFPLGDILSITTERLVSRRHMRGVHKLLDFLTGDVLFTRQLPRAARECQPLLAAQFPELAAIEVPDFPTPDSVLPWLAEQEARFGAILKVAPLPAGVHRVIDPIAEAIEMKGAENVIVVKGDRSGG
jgi:hypothetical protein